MLPAFPHSRKAMYGIPCHFCDGKGDVPNEARLWRIDGRELKERRLLNLWTLRNASKLLNIPATALSDMEIGKAQPDMSILEDYAILEGKAQGSLE